MTTPFVIDTPMLLVALGAVAAVVGTLGAYALVRVVSVAFGPRRSSR